MDDDDDDGEWHDPAVLCSLDHGGVLGGGGGIGSSGDIATFAWVDSSTLVSAGRGRTIVWDVVSGTEVYRFDEPGTEVATSPVEPLIALSSAAEGRPVRLVRFTRDGDQVNVTAVTTMDKVPYAGSPCFTPDGLQLAILELRQIYSGGPQLTLYNVQSGSAEREIRLDNTFVSCLDISPDGRHAAIGRADGTATTWALETPQMAFAKILLLRSAPKGAKLRVTTTDAASRGHHILLRLADEGKVTVAAYVLKFIF